jgi:thymidylate synthase
LKHIEMDLIENHENKENEFNKKHEEYQYLEKIKEVIQFGNTRIDRTNIGTKSMFGTQSRYSLRNSNY